MPFSEVERVIYKRNPLDQVICQLKFPPILRIDAEAPAQFQEMIRGDFPVLSADVVAEVHRTSRIRLSETDQVQLKHFLAKTANDNEPCFVTDADYSTTQKTENDDVIKVLDRFNGHSRRVWRWCIKDRLHEAMGPVDV